MTDLALALAATAAYGILLLSIGFPVARRVTGEPKPGLASCTAAGAGAAALLLTGLSHLHRFEPIPLLLFAIAAGIAGFLNRRPLWEMCQESIRFARNRFLPQTGWMALGFVLLLLLYVLLAGTPARSADAMRYHLAVTRDIIENHGFVFRPYYSYNYGRYFNLLAAPLHMLAGGVGVQCFVLLAFIAAACGTAAMAVRAGIRSVPLLVGTLLLLPISFHEATIVADDWVAVAFAVLAFLLVDTGREPGRRRNAWIGFFSLGLAIGVKYHCLLLVPWLLLIAWNRDRSGRGERARGCAAGCVALSLALAPFAIRNMAYTGSPFWPLLQDLFFTPHDYLYDLTQTYTRRFCGSHSLGAAYLSLRGALLHPLIPATVWILALVGLILRKGARYRIGTGLLVYMAAWWVIEPVLYWRYSVFVLPFALLSAVEAYDAAVASGRPWQSWGVRLLVSVTVLYGAVIAVYYSADLISWYGRRDLRTYHRATWYWDEYRWMDKHLPADASVLAVLFSGHTYYLPRPYWRADPHLSGLIDWRSVGSAEDLVAECRKLGTGYVIFSDYGWPSYPPGMENMQNAMRALEHHPDVAVLRRVTTAVAGIRLAGAFHPAEVTIYRISLAGESKTASMSRPRESDSSRTEGSIERMRPEKVSGVK